MQNMPAATRVYPNDGHYRRRKSIGRRSAILMAIAVLAVFVHVGVPSKAQCVLTSPTTCTMGTMCTAMVSNNHPVNLYLCTRSVNNNANCNPHFGPLAAGGGKVTLKGTAIGTNPQCAWNCCVNVAFVDMTPSDGLPVELMDFSVGEDDPADEGEEAQPTDEDPSD